MLNFSASAKVESEYSLNCKIVSKIKYYDDEDKNGNKFRASTVLYFLIPQESTHQVLFFDAWLPTVEEETFEVAAIIHSPINKPARLGVRRSNKDCPEHHLYLMTTDIESEIDAFVKWTKKEWKSSEVAIKITILPQTKEDQLDI
jgi:hypothetical protein